MFQIIDIVDMMILIKSYIIDVFMEINASLIGVEIDGESFLILIFKI